MNESILTPLEIEMLRPLPGDMASSGPARCITALEERLRRSVTHAEFERIMANTILDQRAAIENLTHRPV